MALQGEILAEKGKKGIFRTKIRTWTTMPLKVGIIATFRGLLSDASPPGFRFSLPDSKYGSFLICFYLFPVIQSDNLLLGMIPYIPEKIRFRLVITKIGLMTDTLIIPV